MVILMKTLKRVDVQSTLTVMNFTLTVIKASIDRIVRKKELNVGTRIDIGS